MGSRRLTFVDMLSSRLSHDSLPAIFIDQTRMEVKAREPSYVSTAMWVVSSLSLFRHCFWVYHVFCVGALTETALDKFPKASQDQYMENGDYYLNLTQEYFFSSLDATLSINPFKLKPWWCFQIFVLLYLHIQVIIKYCQFYLIIILKIYSP